MNNIIWTQYKKTKLGRVALFFLLTLFLIGLYAPFLASSKPFIVAYEGKLYFPFFRSLFYRGFYTKEIDLFYNVLMFTLPLGLACYFLFKQHRKLLLTLVATLQIGLFVLFSFGIVKDPQSEPTLTIERQEILKNKIPRHSDPLLSPLPQPQSWKFDLGFLNDYNKMTLLLRYQGRKLQEERLSSYGKLYFEKTGKTMPTLSLIEEQNRSQEIASLEKKVEAGKPSYDRALAVYPELEKAYRRIALRHLYDKSAPEEDNEKEVITLLTQSRKTIIEYREALYKLNFLKERSAWLATESEKLHVYARPLLRPFHWEEDAGGGQGFNAYLPWWELTRLNRKDLVASLLFGIRVSLVVGVTAIALALLIGIPAGLISGYFAGKVDITMCRIIEIWEAMPTFFMLLMIVAITQSKSIFLVVATLGLFGWTGFARFMRGEVLKIRQLPYVQACHSLGFGHTRIMGSHILPNAIPPILTLLPFSMMAAITSEAGLSFLGLGEEGSASLGVLMNEGRSVFPGESYLLWPPAILLTVLLVAIALVGDALRDAIDPKMRQ